jgi:hypothetical protein
LAKPASLLQRGNPQGHKYQDFELEFRLPQLSVCLPGHLFFSLSEVVCLNQDPNFVDVAHKCLLTSRFLLLLFLQSSRLSLPSAGLQVCTNMPQWSLPLCVHCLGHLCTPHPPFAIFKMRKARLFVFNFFWGFFVWLVGFWVFGGFVCFWFFVLGLEFSAYTLSHSTSPFL